MSTILYYSNHCPNCQKLLRSLARSAAKDDIHFVCVDDRVTKPDGSTHVRLQNQQELLLPPTITKVPALLLLNKGHHVLFGEDIDRHFEPQETQAALQATGAGGGEPQAFSFSGGGFGVTSDTFSFLDQSADQMAAKGEGGMRQQHHYAALSHNDNIQTPPDTYEPDKVGPTSMEALQGERDAALQAPK
tara:strand:+ start:366 stop:932 length:567 start_codon:yes stop_codon:yes gene_type:complete